MGSLEKSLIVCPAYGAKFLYPNSSEIISTNQLLELKKCLLNWTNLMKKRNFSLINSNHLIII